MVIDFNGQYKNWDFDDIATVTDTACDSPVYGNIQGNFDDKLNFEYGKETEIVDGCGVTFLGEFWYFGGWYEDRQVR